MSEVISSAVNSPAVDPLRAAVGELFSAFQRMFPNRWDKQFSDEKARPTWFAALRAAGVDAPMVRRGLATMAKQRVPWPPSAGEFADLCMPAAPALDAALREACTWARNQAHEFSHAAIGAAAASVGTWNLRALDERSLRAAFGTAYRTALDRMARGESLGVPIPKALPAKVRVSTPQGAPTPPSVLAEQQKIARLLGLPL